MHALHGTQAGNSRCAQHTQVRTHAQKYFIKLARQNKGVSAGGANKNSTHNGNDGDNSSSGEASTCSRSNVSCSNISCSNIGISSSTNFETGPSNSDSTSSNMSGEFWHATSCV